MKNGDRKSNKNALKIKNEGEEDLIFEKPGNKRQLRYSVFMQYY